VIRAALVALCLAAPAALPAAAQGTADPIVRFEAGDPEMAAAIAAARKTLPAFLAATLDAEGYGPDDGYLKVAFPVQHPEMETENIWVGPFRRFPDGVFVGLLANDPHAMPGLRNGDRVEFDQAMIVDWNLAAGGGKVWGDYTTRVVVGRLPEDQAAPLRARFSDPPVPSDWPAP
jgi:uncharacterized protein YegJ (DUF2314 family)